MRVTMKKAMADPRGPVGVGQVVDVSDAEGEQLVAGGYAVIAIQSTISNDVAKAGLAQAEQRIETLQAVGAQLTAKATEAPAATDAKTKAEQAKAKREAAAAEAKAKKEAEAKAKADKKAAEATAPAPE